MARAGNGIMFNYVLPLFTSPSLSLSLSLSSLSLSARLSGTEEDDEEYEELEAVLHSQKKVNMIIIIKSR